jgi:hypothetical protein
MKIKIKDQAFNEIASQFFNFKLVKEMSLNLSAEAAPTFQWRPYSTEPLVIALCVTNADGTGKKGLTKDDFVIIPMVGNVGYIHVISVEIPNYISSDGFYTLYVTSRADDWVPGIYIFGIMVGDGTSTNPGGRTVVKLELPPNAL